MFEKYHLVHIDIQRPMTSTPDGVMAVSDSGKRNLSAFRWFDFADAAHDSRLSEYRWTGSFDMLLSPASHSDGDAALYLQSFFLMHNAEGSYVRRSDYPSLLLSYTYAGEGELRYGGAVCPLKEGQAFVIDCRQPHEYRTADRWEHLDIHIWGEGADRFCQHFARENIVVIPYPRLAFDALAERLLDTCTTISDHGNLFTENALSNLLCSLLEHAEKKGKSSLPPAFKTVLGYMEENCTRPLSLDELASFVNLSKSHFAREFKRYTGSSPNDYLIGLRIRYACVQLLATDLPVEEIANGVGIHNMSNFIKQFKKRTGLTPGAFRRSPK